MANDEDSGRVQPPAGQARVPPPANPREPVAMGAPASPPAPRAGSPRL